MPAATQAPPATVPELPPYPTSRAWLGRGRVKAQLFNADADMQERLQSRVDAAVRNPKFDSAREMRLNELLPQLNNKASLYFKGYEAIDEDEALDDDVAEKPDYRERYHATRTGRREFRKAIKKLDSVLNMEKSWWGDHGDAVASAAGTYLFTFLLGEHKEKPTRLNVGVKRVRDWVQAKRASRTPSGGPARS